jgi:frataxin
MLQILLKQQQHQQPTLRQRFVFFSTQSSIFRYPLLLQHSPLFQRQSISYCSIIQPTKHHTIIQYSNNNYEYSTNKHRYFLSSTSENTNNTTNNKAEDEFEHRAEHLLAHLETSLDKLATHLPIEEISLSMGVLTIDFGKQRGIWVINKQKPNRQIWWSSPISGPKRFEFIDGKWRNARDSNVTLIDLLSEELSKFDSQAPKLNSIVKDV